MGGPSGSCSVLRHTCLAWGRSLAQKLLQDAGIEKKNKKPKHIDISCLDSFRYPLFFFFFFLGPHLWHMEVPRLGVESELHLPAYTTAIATQDPSRVCDLHHSSQQFRISDPLNKARDQTCILIDTSWIRFCCTTMGTP